jgi:peptidoglycan/LPS O-acetylase OafA/YrhL
LASALFSGLVDSRKNNVRILRLFAASAVIMSHSILVLSRDPLREHPSYPLFGELAANAVNLFFVLSGFLVARGLLERRDVVDYLLSRVLRIHPALIVNVCLTAFVMGPLVTTLPLQAYFATKSVYGFAVYEGLAFTPFHIRSELPGVFTQLTAITGATVNGSLWTLPWEVWMYGILLLAWQLRLLGRPFPLIFLAALSCYAAMVLGWHSFGEMGDIAVRFVAFFYSGVALYRFRDRIPLGPVLYCAATAVFVLVSWATHSWLLMPLWLAYSVAFLGYHPRLVLERLSDGPDYSYGIYIYAYPVQQLLVLWLHPQSVPLHVGLTLAFTLPLAMLSWHLVEAPALAVKRLLRNARFPKFVSDGAPAEAIAGGAGQS